ncbi:MAG: mandelate racemase/muconate lactonizing enzyme family protein, partial [Planctomycetaceae bacterium]|nr:mandelate racemase/muconate lactonizing enzyme family protein [Planctomycetaceae bacterium]
GGSLALPEQRRIELFIPWADFKAESQMKIVEVVCQLLRVPNVERKTASSQDAVLVRIRTDDGLEGIGEADSQPEVVKAIIDAPFSHNIACGLRELLIGEDSLDTGRLWQKMHRATMYYGRSSVTITAMAAVDMALWDLKGKRFGAPIYQLLGGKHHDRFQAYASCLFGRNGAQTREIAQRWRDLGYRAIKFGWEPMGPDLRVDLDLVRGAREGIGDGLLMIDAGCVWDARTALQRAEAFAEYDLVWLEEPLQSNDVDGYRWLRDRSPIPIAGGEQECGRESWRPLIDTHALDIYQLDLARNGFTEADYIRQRVQEIGARPCNHCYTSPVTVAASLQWLATCRDAFVFEDCVDDSPLRHQLTHEKVQAVDGWISLPQGPGLGITLDEDFVARFLVAQSGR